MATRCALLTIVLMFLQGCLYFYHDDEKTVLVSVLKDVDADKIKADPNSLEISKYSADPESMTILTPWGIWEVK